MSDNSKVSRGSTVSNAGNGLSPKSKRYLNDLNFPSAKNSPLTSKMGKKRKRVKNDRRN